jgi:hypothetical protein
MGRYGTGLGNIQPAELGHDRIPHPDISGVTDRASAYRGIHVPVSKGPSLGSHGGACAGSAMVMWSAAQDPGHTSASAAPWRIRRQRPTGEILGEQDGAQPVRGGVWFESGRNAGGATRRARMLDVDVTGRAETSA